MQIIFCIGLFGFILPALWSSSKVVGIIGFVLCSFGLAIIIVSPLYALYLQKSKSPKLNPETSKNSRLGVCLNVRK